MTAAESEIVFAVLKLLVVEVTAAVAATIPDLAEVKLSFAVFALAVSKVKLLAVFFTVCFAVVSFCLATLSAVVAVTKEVASAVEAGKSKAAAEMAEFLADPCAIAFAAFNASVYGFGRESESQYRAKET